MEINNIMPTVSTAQLLQFSSEQKYKSTSVQLFIIILVTYNISQRGGWDGIRFWSNEYCTFNLHMQDRLVLSGSWWMQLETTSGGPVRESGRRC